MGLKGFGQAPDSLNKLLLTNALQVNKNQKDSVIYTKIKKRFSKNKWLNELYHLVFQDIYNTNAVGQEVTSVEENPFQMYEGRVIRNIYIKRLRVFGESVIDTVREATSSEKFFSSLHTNTKEWVIRKSFLMFQSGDILDADRLKDNERLMRNSNILHDARILVIPDELFPNLVDLLVVTQDIWSLIPDVGMGGLSKYDVSINQVNFLGLGHSWRNTFFMNFLQKPAIEYATTYTVPYIGRSFVTGQLDMLLRRQNTHYGFKLFRPFLTPEMKMAGGFELRYDLNRQTTTRGYDATTLRQDSTFLFFPVAQNYVDVWLARSYKLPFLTPENQSRTRLVVGARFSNTIYTQRPKVSADTNQLFRNHTDYLLGVGFSNRRYKRDVLIYGFGITEDVPYGYLATFVTGVEHSDILGNRAYVGFKGAWGRYLPHNGYLYALVNAGGYSNGTTGLSIESNYFSKLSTFRKSQLRHFLTFKYAFGNNRYTGEFLNINGENGMLGISSDKLWGTKKLTWGYQAVLFSRVNLVGFRMAPFFQIDFAYVAPRFQQLIQNAPFTGIGLGIRLRNENLTFNTFQLKFTYYPNLPDIQTLNAAFSDTYNLRLRDFDIAAPEIVPFR